MKVKAIEVQNYFTANEMPITTGEIYEADEHHSAFRRGSRFVTVTGDDGSEVIMLGDEFEVVE